MIGNSYGVPMFVDGFSSTNGTMSASFLAYDPSLGMGSTGATSGGYVELTTGDKLSVWQGVFAQVTGVPASSSTMNYRLTSSACTTGTPPFYGRTASSRADRPTTFALMLDGEVLHDGTLYPVVDYVTKARFRDGATDDFDRYDLGELAPPNGIQAALAFVGTRDGEPYRLGVHSMPEALKGSVVLPVEFATTAPGTFTLSPELVSIPEGWTASLRDLETGDIVDLTGGESHTFTADAPMEWTRRFEMTVAASSSVASEEASAEFALSQIFPNPSVSASSMRLRVETPQVVRASVVDALGREVQEAFVGEVSPGAEAQITVDTSVLAPGAYVVRVEGETFAQSRQLTVTR